MIKRLVGHVVGSLEVPDEEDGGFGPTLEPDAAPASREWRGSVGERARQSFDTVVSLLSWARKGSMDLARGALTDPVGLPTAKSMGPGGVRPFHRSFSIEVPSTSAGFVAECSNWREKWATMDAGSRRTSVDGVINFVTRGLRLYGTDDEAVKASLALLEQASEDMGASRSAALGALTLSLTTSMQARKRERTASYRPLRIGLSS